MILQQSNSQRHAIDSKSEPIFHWEHNLKAIRTVSLKETDGRWIVIINGGAGLPASDIEVWLWLRLIESRKRNKQ